MKTKGFSLIEVVIGSAVILLVTVGLLGAYSLYIRASATNTENIQTALLLEETVESVKLLRDANWTSNIVPLVAGTKYRLTWDTSTSAWRATTTYSLIDSKFDRYFIVNNAYRNASSNYTSSSTPGATLDTGSRTVNAYVLWDDHGATSTKMISTYITNLFNN